MTETTPNQPTTKRVSLKNGCLTVLAIIGGITVLGSLSDRTPSTPSAAAPELAAAPAATQTPAVQATATEIFEAYQSNQLAAAQLYADKPLRVSGRIDSIDESFGAPVIRLVTSNQFMSLGAEFPEEAASQLVALRPGARVTVLCQQLQEAGGFINLSDCALSAAP